MRSYLAVAGGIDVPEVMGSRSTDLKVGIGGFEGRLLRDGDRLAIGVSTRQFSEPQRIELCMLVGNYEMVATTIAALRIQRDF